MTNRTRTTIPRLALVVALALLHLSGTAALALEEPPPFAIFHQSLSDGLRLSTDDCAEALKALTAGLLGRSSVTYVTGTGAKVPVGYIAREVPLPPPIGLVYTLEGPRYEVAILACAPAAIAK